MRLVGRVLALAGAGCLLMPTTSLLAASPGPGVSPSASVTVTSARALTDVVGDPTPWFAALSPSGSMLAYYTESGRGRDRLRQLCAYTFSTAAKACHDLPEVFDTYPYQLAWSPDESRIAFGENPIEFGEESDIWLLDVVAGQVTNVTDDGLSGSWREAASQGVVTIDYLPFWDRVDGSLLFWRVTPLGDLRFDLSIYRLPGGTGEPALVRDIGADAAGHLPTFEQERFFLDGPSALSPDGSTVAALMTSVDEMGTSTVGLWFFDLGGDSTPAVEAVSQDALDAPMPTWQAFPATALGVSWTADSAGVVVLSSSYDPHTPMTVFNYVDAGDRVPVPIVDFSGLDAPEALLDPAPGGQVTWRAYSPWTAAMSPHEDRLLMLNDLGGVAALMAASLPPDGTLPAVVASADSTVSSTASRSSRSTDGKVTIYGLLVSVEEP